MDHHLASSATTKIGLRAYTARGQLPRYIFIIIIIMPIHIPAMLSVLWRARCSDGGQQQQQQRQQHRKIN